jgi:hypothetical protein
MLGGLLFPPNLTLNIAPDRLSKTNPDRVVGARQANARRRLRKKIDKRSKSTKAPGPSFPKSSASVVRSGPYLS